MKKLGAFLACILTVGAFAMETVTKPEAKIIGIEVRTINTPEAAPHDIPQLWERFFRENLVEQIPNKTSGEILGLYCDYEGDHTQPYSLVVGCEVSSLDDIPEGMVGKVVPETTFAVFPVSGNFPESLITQWKAIWADQTLKRTYTHDFELYSKNFEQDKQLQVLIAVEPNS